MINKTFFLQPKNNMQKKYEALRAAYVDNLSNKEIAHKFGYTLYSFKSIRRDCKNVSADFFFKGLKKGPTGHHRRTLSIKERIVQLRKRNFSIPEIHEKLKEEYRDLSIPIINKILHEEGFTKLFRRTFRERLESYQSDKIYPEYADTDRFGEKTEVTTSFGGIFLFIPIIIDLKLDQLFQTGGFYGTKAIPPISYMLSYLGLKLLGKDRICHIDDFGFDYGLGVFSKLNVFPKSASIGRYSYKNSKGQIRKLLKGFVKMLHARGYIKGSNINLDFHSIPYYGEESTLQDHWVPMRGKRMTSVLSFFAQDLDTTYLCFSDADIKKEKMNDEIVEFVKFYEDSTGVLPERLIFDSKLTTYKNLNELNKKGILFITLKRRGKNFEKQISRLSCWKKIRLDNIKRKYRNLEYAEDKIKIKNYAKEIRWIVVKGNGRDLPMSLLTNDFESSAKEIITYYAHRWRIENNIQENVDFFNLNAISSPIVVKVDFDIAITLIANTLYKIFANKTKWFEAAKPKKVSRNFIEVKSKIKIENNKVIVNLGEKNHDPLLMDWVDSLHNIRVPWWDNRKLNFKFGFR